ncbi:MAG: DegV family protein, partial [Abiotrophia defectiva]|nr:DegV family protein [Abiotrophia defectiva]
ALLDQLVAAGYDTVYAIHLSSEISGTYQTARMLLSEYEDKLDAYAVDSGSSCMVMEILVKETLGWIDQGLSAEEVGRRLEWSARHSDVYLMVGDLNNLVKGGRLSASSAILGNILQIRPLLHFEEGKIAVTEKIRTTKKVYRRMVELVAEWQTRYPQDVHVGIGQAGAPEDLKVLDEMMKEAYPGMPLSYTNIGPVIGTHTGDGTKGLGIVPKLPADF